MEKKLSADGKRMTKAVKVALEAMCKSLDQDTKKSASAQEVLVGFLQGVGFLLLDTYERSESKDGQQLIESDEFRQKVKARVVQLVEEGDIGTPEDSLVLTFALMRSFQLIGEIEQPAQERTPLRLVDPRGETSQPVALREIKIDGGCLD